MMLTQCGAGLVSWNLPDWFPCPGLPEGGELLRRALDEGALAQNIEPVSGDSHIEAFRILPERLQGIVVITVVALAVISPTAILRKTAVTEPAACLIPPPHSFCPAGAGLRPRSGEPDARYQKERPHPRYEAAHQQHGPPGGREQASRRPFWSSTSRRWADVFLFRMLPSSGPHLRGYILHYSCLTSLFQEHLEPHE